MMLPRELRYGLWKAAHSGNSALIPITTGKGKEMKHVSPARAYLYKIATTGGAGLRCALTKDQVQFAWDNWEALVAMQDDIEDAWWFRGKRFSHYSEAEYYANFGMDIPDDELEGALKAGEIDIDHLADSKVISYAKSTGAPIKTFKRGLVESVVLARHWLKLLKK